MIEVSKSVMLQLYSNYLVFDLLVVDSKIYGRKLTGEVVWCNV